jgi:hypothetical protein
MNVSSADLDLRLGDQTQTHPKRRHTSIYEEGADKEHKLKQRNTMLMQKVEVLHSKTGMYFAGFPLSMASSVKILTVVTYMVLFAWDTAWSSRQPD